MSSYKSVREIFAAYKEWVIAHPNVVTDVETLTKWTSYYIAGKINKSSVISELVYSLSNLFVLYNDTILLKSMRRSHQSSAKEKLKFWLTVLHVCEVFMEMSVRNKWGNQGKWSIAAVIQMFKCVSNLILVFHYKELAVQHPPMPSVQRNKLNDNEEKPKEGFVLKHSGRVIRKVEESPPVSLRNWVPLKSETAPSIVSVDNLRIAETLYTLKPMLHLGAVACFGSENWKQWLLPLGVDLTSLYMYDKQMNSLSYDQRIEISRRKLSLLYYLLRSPMFEKHTREALVKFLTGTANKVPLAGYICNPILQYMSHWQSTYFYMWAN